jgi:Flp pilus assembly protein TadG
VFHCLQKRFKRGASAGQNLIELALSFGFVLVLLFATIEISRVWLVYTATRNAAMDGAVTASQYHDTGRGMQQIDKRLALAKLSATSRSITVMDNNIGYEASVAVMYKPLFANMALPVPGGKITIIPAGFPVSYSSTKFYAIY